ncbi:hypothetical protein [Psychrobacter sp. M13]|uniref:hypothetical protein n=1 Tax=Psychrobacter sp. M13 TaxID=3067275 RepID=UPI00273B45F3|nr:hypothetical protein [Psychrobacter sp. M13]WLP95342.1 hypothetical protein Q9G97_04355 [Psychrobacter sp. M13]
MMDKKIKYLDSTTQTLKDEELLGNTVLRQWEVIVELIDQTKSLNLDKPILLEKTESDMGQVTSENFRKRMSMLNQEFSDNNLGIEIKNSKSSVVIAIDEEKLNDNLNQQTAEFIKQSNAHNKLDGDKLVSPKASAKPTESKRQVLFSYSWEPNKEELNAQRQFATMLEDSLKNPPAKFQNSPRVSLFTDYKDFELGEDQTEQQDAMCQETPMAVICYTHKYLHSTACKREIDYYLTEDGNNLPNRRALVLPFDCSHGEMDARYQKNLAMIPPTDFINGLDFFTSASPANKKTLVGQLVENIYNWFNKNPTPPKFDKHYDVKNTLRDTGNSIDLAFQSPEYLKGNTQQHQYEGAIDIVDLMYNWSTDTANMETRLFYLLGDFGSGKSTSCQMLTKKLMDNYNDKIAKNDIYDSPPVLPIYLDLKKLLNAFSNQRDIAIQPINSLLETMLSSTGVTKKVSGDSIIQFINEYPCLLIFDGFDEVGQKLNAQQQTGLLNKLLEIFPKSVYQQDLNRLNQDNSQKISSAVPINSRILISCRTHFFKNYAEQDAFHQLYYRHEAGVSAGEIKNYQIYYLLPFTKEQIQSYLVNWLGKTDAEKALKFINNVHDLSGLSERPLMLNLIRDLLPELQKEFKNNPHINASTLYKLLFDKVGYRDNEKHLIPLDEKRKLLGRFALYLWQQGITTLHVDALDNWMLDNRNDYPQLNIKLNSGQYDPEVILQDLHNASLLVRDNDDEYRFAHTSFFEFFVAVGIFDSVIHCNNTEQGFDLIFNRDNLGKEIVQFLIDWRLTIRESEKDKFDQRWQQLQQVDSDVNSRQIAFGIWYFAYSENQEFTVLDKPNWQGLKLVNIKLDKQLENNILDLSEINLSDASIEECSFSFTDLSKMNLTDTYFRQNKFDVCKVEDWTDETTLFHENRFNNCLTPNIWQSYSLLHSNLVTPSNGSKILNNSFILQQLIHEKSSGNLACLHPDGIQIILGGEGGASLWQITDENNIICLHRFLEEVVTSCEFSPNGSQLVTAGHRGASLWQITDDNNISRLYHFLEEEVITSCKFSPDGSQLVTAGHSGVALWQITDDNVICLQHFLEEVVSSCEFSPDGSQIITAGHRGGSLWQITNDNVICLQHFLEEVIASCKFSPDGSQLVTVGHSGSILWQITDDSISCLHKFSDERLTRSCQFSPNGSQLVTAGHGGASLWEITDDNISCLHKFSDEFFIRSCKFNPDGSQIITAGHSGAILWQITDDNISCLHKFSDEYGIENCDFGCDGLCITLGSHRGASLWQITDDNNIICLHKFSDEQPITSCKFSPDGSKLVTAGLNGVALWQITDDNISCLHKFSDEFFIRSCEFSPDGSQLVIGGHSSVILWQIVENDIICLHKLSDEYGTETCQFSPDGSQLVIGGYRGASLWQITNHNNISRLRHFLEEEVITSCKFSPDGSQLVTAGHNGVALWQITDDNISCLHKFSDEENVASCQFSPDGSQLVTAGHSGVALWQITDDNISCLHKFSDEENVTSCQFSPDGSQLVTAGYSGVILWQITDDNNISRLRHFLEEEVITSCNFSLDGSQIITAGHSGVILWQITDDIICLNQIDKSLRVFDIDRSSASNSIAITSFDRTYLYSLKDNKIFKIGVLQFFDDATISYTDDSFTNVSSIQGKAWKYLYNKVTTSDNTIQILAPDTHPDWDKAYHE